MITKQKPSKTFEDLIVWQKSRELTSIIYKITEEYPGMENYGLIPQMRRAAISVSSNIAEGFGRLQSKDKEHYYVMAAGSLTELLSQLIISRDLGYISYEKFKATKSKLVEVQKLLAALLSAHRG